MLSPSLPRTIVIAASMAALCLTSTACGDGPVEPSLLEQPRVLAVRVEGGALKPGEDATVEALLFGVNPDSLAWRLCLGPWIPPNPDIGYDDLTCSFGETPLGGDNPLTVPVPNEIEQLGGVWLALDGDGDTPAATPILTTIFSVGTAGPAVQANHFVASAQNAEGASIGEPTTVVAGTDLSINAVLDASHDPRAVVNWYTTGGLFEPFRTFGTDVSVLTAPETAGEITIYAVLRNPDNGVAWYMTTVQVTAAPGGAQ